MKVTIWLILTLLVNSTRAQHCDTVDGRLINCIDVAGLKQGVWEEAIYGWVPGEPIQHTSYCSYVPSIRKRIGASMVGFYKNGIKAGTWDYYDDAYYYRAGNAYKRVTYMEDGSTLEDNNKLGYELWLNKDSTIAASHSDTIYIICKDTACSLMTSTNKIFKKFHHDKLQDQLLLFSWGEFRRDIRLANKEN
jgi:hypothetical protein